MAVQLEGTIRRYIGPSTDPKPFVGQVEENGHTITAADLPAGSTVLETDTGDIYRWDGADWRIPSPDEALLLVQQESLLELKAIRTGIELLIVTNGGPNIDLRTEVVAE